jgi:hypothetical protein
MSSDNGIRVEGLRELNRSLSKAGADAEDMKDLNASIAKLVADTGRGRAPVVTGALAASVKGNRAKGKAVVKAGGARIPYAGPIHWGWPRRNIAGSLFLSDAVDDNHDQIIEMFEDGVDKVLRKNNLK